MLAWIILNFLTVCTIIVLYHRLQSEESINILKRNTTETEIETIQMNYTRKKTTYKPSKKKDIKYILLYPATPPLDLYVESQSVFINNHCKYQNCYVTSKVKYLKDITDFDAILFSGTNIKYVLHHPIKKRKHQQVYVYCNLDAAGTNSVMHPFFDNFFNWTWTYKLDSDIKWKPFKVYDLKGNELGPKVNMQWPKEMKPIDSFIKWKLRNKSRAAARFMQNCNTHRLTNKIFRKLEEQLQLYGLSVDVYGNCGKLKCDNDDLCNMLLQKYYYFYISFEKTLDIDYVSDDIVRALQNSVVPIVYGGANYSRFLPPGSYLNARELGPLKLAKLMNDIISNKTLYYEFFRWEKYIKFERTIDTEMCNICEALNDQKKLNVTKTYDNFRAWWNNPTRQKMFKFLLRNFIFNKDLLNLVSNSSLTGEVRKAILRKINKQSSVPRKVFYFDYDKQKMDIPDQNEATESLEDITITALDFTFSTSDAEELYTGSTVNMDYSETQTNDVTSIIATSTLSF